MTSESTTITHRRHYTTGLILVLGILFGLLYLLINPLSHIDESAVTNFSLAVPGLFQLMVAISAIGAPVSMVVLALAWSGIELAWGRRDRAIVMAASLLSAPIFYLFKQAIHRARPASQYVDDLQLHSYSFPSGHASMSFTILMILAYLLSLRLPRLWSRVATSILILIVILIGISRVYVQSHYPTDVVGGWLLGGMILLGVRSYVATYERKTGKTIKA